MAEWNELAVLGQLVTGLFPKFAQCNLFDCFRGVAGIADPGYNIDLTRGHFQIASRIGIRSWQMRTSLPSCAIGAMTAAALRCTIVHVRGLVRVGVCT